MRQSFTDFTKRQEGDGKCANPFDRITDNTVTVTGTDAGEREGFMTEKIREYSMNGALIIGVDSGYGNMKTARRCFKTAIAKYDNAPVLSRDYIEYGGAYYVIGEGRKGFVADKQTDDDNYVLTLAAIVKELEARGMTEDVNRAKIHLAVGLPLKWVQAQREDFKRYMLRNSRVEVGYKDRIYCIEFAGCTVMPQCYSAVTENLKDVAGVTLLADIGNGTMNLMYLNNGRPMESKAWTEKLGVFQCFQKIHNMVQDNTGDNLMEDVIDNILRTGKNNLPEPHASLVEKAICEYVDEIFQKMRDHEYNERLMKAYFMGCQVPVAPVWQRPERQRRRGARLVENFGEYNPENTVFNHDIRANAKGC